jgi:ABC-type transport system substrate-binding protein
MRHTVSPNSRPHKSDAQWLVILSFVFFLFTLLILSGPQSSLGLQQDWAYPSGYDPHGGYVDRITFKVYPSEDLYQAIQNLQVGGVYSYDDELDPLTFDINQLAEIEAHPDIEMTSEPGTSYRQFTLNCQRFPTNLTGYRVALAYALDKYQVVENARHGFAQVMDNSIPLAFEFWSYEDLMASHFYTEDIVSANATLDAAHIIDTPDSPHPGWRYYDADMSGNWTLGDKRGDTWAADGLKIELWVSATYCACSDFLSTLSLIASMEKCGLEGVLVEVDFNTLITGLESGEYNVGCFKWTINPLGIPTLLYDFFHTEGEDNSFFYRYNNSEYDYNCTQFMSAPTRLEARNWAWNCCRILIADMPMIVCYNLENIHMYRTDIWEGYVNQVGIGPMGGNPYTYQSIRLKPEFGGPFGCIPTEYVTILSEGMDYTNMILSSSEYSQTIFDLIYSKLWRIDPLDPLTAPAPDLAYAWTLEPTTASGDVQEGMKYTFYLFENITWHDGTPFTAEDVQYNLMNIHKWGTETSENVASIYRVDIPDDYTIEIYSNESDYVTFTQATSVQILPKHIWLPYEAENFTWTPESINDFTGTGCYQWVARIIGQEIILDRYEDWHFAVEHPERPPCGLNLYFTQILIVAGIGGFIIAIQVLILGLLLHRRRKAQAKKGEPTT